jgi:hypothetical protein
MAPTRAAELSRRVSCVDRPSPVAHCVARFSRAHKKPPSQKGRRLSSSPAVPPSLAVTSPHLYGTDDPLDRYGTQPRPISRSLLTAESPASPT